MRRILGIAVAAGLMSAAAMAQAPRITKAKMQTRSAAAGLEREVKAISAGQADPAWIGYAVTTSGDGQMCCYDNMRHDNWGCCGRCGLEEKSGSYTTSGTQGAAGNKVKLEGPRTILVLFRVEQRVVGKIRTFSEDCEIDAGGLPFFWLMDVKPAESVAYLSGFVRAYTTPSDDDKTPRKMMDGALSAIAMHKDESGIRAVEGFAAAGQPDRVREQAIFWLGAGGGARGFEVLKRIVREDPSERIRDRAVFALYTSRQPGSTDEIIRAARDDRSSKVRGQALFWLAQKAGERAAGFISATIENDPDTEVKKKAVFALSQLPKDEGVPKLIEVARNNKNPAVRKQAMFWLGQSKDPRALEFFTQILKSN
jgi:hypothetical protein